MKLLLDTHIVVWAAAAPERLGRDRALIEESDRIMSAASAWELAVKQGLGKVDLGEAVRAWFPRAARELDATLLSISPAHAAAVEALPPIHRDPFDRVLVAQAQIDGLILLTADDTLSEYGPSVRLLQP